jgi:hypothetical protein
VCFPAGLKLKTTIVKAKLSGFVVDVAAGVVFVLIIDGSTEPPEVSGVSTG